MKKKVLIYPCSGEIAFEIYASIRYSGEFEVFGGAREQDRGTLSYENLVTDLPTITEYSNREDIRDFNEAIREYKFDIIYPTADELITTFARYRDELEGVLVAPELETAEIIGMKSKTYESLSGIIPLPKLYEISETPEEYPVFMEPDIGRGLVYGRKIETKEEYERLREEGKLFLNLVMEYLPKKEYIVDCFTNLEGKLLFSTARSIKTIRTGISANTEFVKEDKEKFADYADKINKKLNLKGGWFFKLREDKEGVLKLLEISASISGTSAITRGIGINLTLLTLLTYGGLDVEEPILNKYDLELNRVLHNSYRPVLEFGAVYVNFDDTLIGEDKVNLSLITFLFQCLNEGKKIRLITRHKGEIMPLLKKYRIGPIFDRIFILKDDEKKSDYIDKNLRPIFIDKSYRERKEVAGALEIPVFDLAMVECLLK